MDDDDEFLYGGEPISVAAAPAHNSSTDTPIEGISSEVVVEPVPGIDAPASSDVPGEAVNDEAESESGEDVESDDDDDIEIIMEAPPRSLDFLGLQGKRPAPRSTPVKPPAPPAPALTTEYTPIQRDSVIPLRAPAPQKPPSSPPRVATPLANTSATPAVSFSVVAPTAIQATVSAPDNDSAKLPPVKAPPSHPQINPDIPGTIEGRSVLEVDLAALAPEKPWRRPGADISDWFNYGFDEISWEAYCYRRKEVGDLGALLKSSVLGYAQLDENQVNALPPDFRQMVIAGTFAPPAPVADMGYGNAGGMMPGMMPDMMGGVDGSGEGMDGFGTSGMMGGADYGIQDPSAAGMFPQQAAPLQQQPQPQPQQPPQQPPTQPAARPLPTGPSRGIPGAPRGRGAYMGRGRGIPVGPARATSPLPPNIPTGPRSQTRYKDRDGNAPSNDGLDYGGGGANGSRDDDDRDRDRDSRSRKRRGSPDDGGRASKRR